EFIGEKKEQVTVRHLLTHCAGLVPFRLYFKEKSSAGEILQPILNEPLEYPTGSKTSYSDLDFILLGKIVEKLSGVRLDTFCAEQIFRPLRMADTFFLPDSSVLSRLAPTEFDAWRGRLVHGQVHDENAHALGGVSGHAGLFSTARDLATFLQMLLNGGKYDDLQLLQSGTVALFTRRQNLVPGSSRALGWDTADGANSAGRLMSERAFGHTGYTGTSVWVDPEKEMFVILLSNRVHPTRANTKILKFRALLHDAIMRAMVSH
ncbi:MAG: serine hydrolase, partial [Bacteroidota bacterium]